ncbi:heavy metal translocating P-type ATPase [Rhodoferax bucti]|uniref:heavy metal translocating P-type ATPase n=1 Tax=Rhodoferax bucti TaxID=2576305 RepID=UPI00110817EA|nr:cation-translocating P-type ATPase [Rhodoferax bucti]
MIATPIDSAIESLPEPGALSVVDDPVEWSAFSRQDPHTPAQWESNVVIEGMHCAACSITVEEALRQVPGVLGARVSAASQRAQVQWSADAVLPSQWMQAVQAAGYRAVPANDAFASERRKAESRKALWQWLVAGLCMMQVMMYAWPAYQARPGDLSGEYEQLLRWASWVLTLPVILFSCGPFFRKAWSDVVHARVSMDLPVALGMLITFAASTAGTFDPQGIFGREVYFDSLTMFVFFLLTGRWLELRLRDRTAGALEALMNRMPESVQRRKADGSFEPIAVRRLQVGDVMQVRAGEAFAADGVLEQGSTMVDESLLTGESRPLARGVGDAVVAGSHNLSGTVLVRVQTVGEATRFAQILALMESASTTKPASALLADRLAKPFLIAVLFASLAAGVWWWSTDPGHALMVAVAVLVVTCPCALSLATPAAMLAAAGNLARRGLLVRRLPALESLATADTVVFDKTGTLTRDAMVLRTVHSRVGMDRRQALACAAGLAAQSLHPVSRALVRSAELEAITPWQMDAVAEEAGQGVRSTLAVRAADRAGVQGICRLGTAAFCGLASGGTPGSTDDGLVVHLSDAGGWLATFHLQEELRDDALEVVSSLQAMGVGVHLLSGDRLEAVRTMAQRAGIAHFRGACSPADKLAYMQDLQAQGRVVVMVGDGLNDGPVLAGAHVSFAFGRAVPIAQSRSDFVALGDQLGSVVLAWQLARKTMRVVRQNLSWALAYNLACIPLAVAGYLPAWLAGLGMAASSLLVVGNALRLSARTAQVRTGTLPAYPISLHQEA